jgi:hypothetical protein
MTGEGAVKTKTANTVAKRRSGGTPALPSLVPFCTSIAQLNPRRMRRIA